MIKLTNKDKTYMKSCACGVLKSKGKKYYFKLSYNDAYGTEQISEIMAKKIGINCAHYEIIKADNFYYNVSDDLGGDKKFSTAMNLHFHGTNLYDIWNYFYDNGYKNIPELMNKIVKIYFFDILTMNSDRHSGNWGIIYDGDDVDICILDNELSFDENNPALFTADEKYMEERIIKFLDTNGIELIGIKLNLENLEHFLNTSDKSYTMMFEEIYNTLNVEFLKETISEVEKINGVVLDNKDQLIKSYEENYRLIGEMLENRRTR